MSKKKKSDQSKLQLKPLIVRKLKPWRIFDGVQPFDPEDPYDRIEAEKENQKLRQERKRKEFYDQQRELEAHAQARPS